MRNNRKEISLLIQRNRERWMYRIVTRSQEITRTSGRRVPGLRYASKAADGPYADDGETPALRSGVGVRGHRNGEVAPEEKGVLAVRCSGDIGGDGGRRECDRNPGTSRMADVTRWYVTGRRFAESTTCAPGFGGFAALQSKRHPARGAWKVVGTPSRTSRLWQRSV